jgi:hypothetical protein
VQQELFGVPEPVDLDLEGDGPFALPLCTSVEVKQLGPLTVLRFKTVCDRHVIVTLAEDPQGDGVTAADAFGAALDGSRAPKRSATSVDLPVLARLLSRFRVAAARPTP